MDGKRKKAAAKERTVHGLEQQGEGEASEESVSGDAFSSYYLPGNGGPPLRLDLRSHPEATVAVLSPRCPPVVHGRHRLHGRRPRAPPPLCLAHRLTRAVAFVLLRALVSCVGLGNGSSEAGEGD